MDVSTKPYQIPSKARREATVSGHQAVRTWRKLRSLHDKSKTSQHCLALHAPVLVRKGRRTVRVEEAGSWEQLYKS
jgi:hypothetical protein